MAKTPNLNLNVPDYRDLRWDIPVNENWSLIDTAVAGKQAILTFDVAPTLGSTNPVTSGGIYNALLNIDALPDQTGQGGKFLTTDGENASWAQVDITPDNLSITKDSSNHLQTVGIINSRDASTAIKTWTGTKAQHDAIVTKDPNTLYEVNDDYNVTDIRALGQIVQSTIPLVDAGLHLLDGSVIAYGSYKAFVDYMAGLVTDYPDLFTTEANWQTSVANYGVCGKFVYDSTNNTVRLPKITGFTEGTTDVTALGDLVEAGLPNIEGTFQYAEQAQNVSGAFNLDSTSWAHTSGYSSGGGAYLSFDASCSSSIYGNSTTVQPQSIKVLYYICIATYPKTQIEVDIDEIATDLNGKADTDLSNMNPTQTVKNTIVGWGMPDYSAGILITGTSYTAPKAGFASISPRGGVSGVVYVNGARVGIGSSSQADSCVNFNLDKGDIITLTSGYTFGTANSYFYPFKGAN